MTADPCREALEAIALGRVPCVTCLKAHVWTWKDVTEPKKGGSWADLDDGHAYRRMRCPEYAREVLKRAGVLSGTYRSL